MTPSKCKTCTWRGGRKNPGKCQKCESIWWRNTYWYARSESGPCGPDAKLYEKEKK